MSRLGLLLRLGQILIRFRDNFNTPVLILQSFQRLVGSHCKISIAIRTQILPSPLPTDQCWFVRFKLLQATRPGLFVRKPTLYIGRGGRDTGLRRIQVCNDVEMVSPHHTANFKSKLKPIAWILRIEFVLTEHITILWLLSILLSLGLFKCKLQQRMFATSRSLAIIGNTKGIMHACIRNYEIIICNVVIRGSYSFGKICKRHLTCYSLFIKHFMTWPLKRWFILIL